MSFRAGGAGDVVEHLITTAESMADLIVDVTTSQDKSVDDREELLPASRQELFPMLEEKKEDMLNISALTENDEIFEEGLEAMWVEKSERSERSERSETPSSKQSQPLVAPSAIQSSRMPFFRKKGNSLPAPPPPPPPPRAKSPVVSLTAKRSHAAVRLLFDDGEAAELPLEQTPRRRESKGQRFSEGSAKAESPLAPTTVMIKSIDVPKPEVPQSEAPKSEGITVENAEEKVEAAFKMLHDSLSKESNANRRTLAASAFELAKDARLVVEGSGMPQGLEESLEEAAVNGITAVLQFEQALKATPATPDKVQEFAATARHYMRLVAPPGVRAKPREVTPGKGNDEISTLGFDNTFDSPRNGDVLSVSSLNEILDAPIEAVPVVRNSPPPKEEKKTPEPVKPKRKGILARLRNKGIERGRFTSPPSGDSQTLKDDPVQIFAATVLVHEKQAPPPPELLAASEKAKTINAQTNQKLEKAMMDDASIASVASRDGIKKFHSKHVTRIASPEELQGTLLQSARRSPSKDKAPSPARSLEDKQPSFIPAPQGRPPLLIQRSWESLLTNQDAKQSDAPQIIMRSPSMEKEFVRKIENPYKVDPPEENDYQSLMRNIPSRSPESSSPSSTGPPSTESSPMDKYSVKEPLDDDRYSIGKPAEDRDDRYMAIDAIPPGEEVIEEPEIKPPNPKPSTTSQPPARPVPQTRKQPSRGLFAGINVLGKWNTPPKRPAGQTLKKTPPKQYPNQTFPLKSSNTRTPPKSTKAVNSNLISKDAAKTKSSMSSPSPKTKSKTKNTVASPSPKTKKEMPKTTGTLTKSPKISSKSPKTTGVGCSPRVESKRNTNNSGFGLFKRGKKVEAPSEKDNNVDPKVEAEEERQEEPEEIEKTLDAISEDGEKENDARGAQPLETQSTAPVSVEETPTTDPDDDPYPLIEQIRSQLSRQKRGVDPLPANDTSSVRGYLEP